MKAVATLALLVLLVCAGLPHAHAAQQGAPARRIAGVVLDQTGAPVEGAEVSLRVEDGPERRVRTGADGRFAFEGVVARTARLAVSARGFAEHGAPWKANAQASDQTSEQGGREADEEVRITLAPLPFAESVTVTASRAETSLAETAASVRVLTRDELSLVAAQTLDDALRQVPGFQLFRRTGSRAANPTAQGVSLRGVGASGASRALVLADGVPLNDPFGGWVYWGRVPREAVGRLEVVRGGASHLYGSSALGGVVQILTREAGERPALSLEVSTGNLRTQDGSLYAGGRRGRWDATLAAEIFHTGGYHAVRREERGAADAPVTSRYSSLFVEVGREVKESLRVFARGSVYGEARENGTNLQYNRTHIRQLIVGGDWEGGRAGRVNLRAHASSQVFDQTFSAVSADRNVETLTRLQRVPAQAGGLSWQWFGAVGGRHALLVGGDWREVRGASDEVGFAAGRPTSATGAGGRERTIAIFVEDAFSLSPKLLLTTGVRFDRWRNFGAHAATRPLALSGPVTSTLFADRTESALSPRAALLMRVAPRVSLYGAAYRAFRAPTLNELYRSFRVGDVLTLANEALRAERLTGGEGGASFNSASGLFSVRGAFFWSEVARTVANSTLFVTPQLITRRRENLGRTRSRGLELEAEARLARGWTLTGGYQLTDARVEEFPANRSLEGLRLPQVPRHQLTFGLSYAASSPYRFGLQGRAGGVQFDDDQNLLPLDGYVALDAFASRRLARAVEAFAAAENFLNRRYEVGRTPLTTYGPPLMLRFGLRLRLGPR
jgi:outer membrane receptor protein involved in Fe transport